MIKIVKLLRHAAIEPPPPLYRLFSPFPGCIAAVGMSAEAMVNATVGYLEPGELLYIATDENHADFFKPFRER